jgi:hypothetical protein
VWWTLSRASAGTFILTIDRVHLHPDTRSGNEAEHVFCSASFLIGVGFVPRNFASFLSGIVAPKVDVSPPRLPGFYLHSEWAALGPVHVGVLRSLGRSLMDQPVTRSNPNKAVDVVVNQTSVKQIVFSPANQTNLRSAVHQSKGCAAPEN